MPFGLVQGIGRPDLAAKLHLVELPFYLLILWWLLDDYGIVGVAIAWVIRVSIDAVLLFIMACKLLPEISVFALRPVLVMSVALFLMFIGVIIQDVSIKLGFIVMVLFSFAVFSWFVILAAGERDLVRGRLKVMLVSVSKGAS